MDVINYLELINIDLKDYYNIFKRLSKFSYKNNVYLLNDSIYIDFKIKNPVYIEFTEHIDIDSIEDEFYELFPDNVKSIIKGKKEPFYKYEIIKKYDNVSNVTFRYIPSIHELSIIINNESSFIGTLDDFIVLEKGQ
ncbi:hypothetical protein [Picrophilus oshimae]|uniref:Uncharacterized protein n=1 Tax=Picrophilus torridus (strain ATCC 700027 / DSM 9790 / JCM 10055 / NBRC 100828 / KAW 2/3) TaxID=1122961 RepID=Q6KZ12_PICTO|nr:hypothetical protein [Picrophilus oshimae]AAT44040.1 hypothetical protein PTO1455 [Picrophilus oshimae DSM 9789]